MVRPAQPRTEDGLPAMMTWDGTAQRAEQLRNWARDSAYNTRFSWAAHLDQEARTLVEYPEQLNQAGGVAVRGQSSEWVPTPVGSVIERLSPDRDAPLRVHVPAPLEDPKPTTSEMK
jgi:hypothetical protein